MNKSETDISNEPLDFCRVKKIDEKGFGFLKSLHYPVDIFFHFTQIKKEDFLEKLNDMKRGEFFLYFISKQQQDGRRKAARIWYSLNSVPEEFIDGFIQTLIREFNEGNTNVFDLLHAFDELRKINKLSDGQIQSVLTSGKILNLPTTILPYLTEEEVHQFKKLLNLDEMEKSKTKPFWFDDVRNY